MCGEYTLPNLTETDYNKYHIYEGLKKVSLSRPEFEREVPPIVVSQRNISTRDLCFGSPVLSLSEDTRAYFIIVDYMTMKPCIEIQNLKDDWKVRIEDPISMTLMALSPEGDLITASPKGGLARWKNISPQQKPEPEAIVLKSPPESSIRCMQFKPTGELSLAAMRMAVYCLGILKQESQSFLVKFV